MSGDDNISMIDFSFRCIHRDAQKADLSLIDCHSCVALYPGIITVNATLITPLISQMLNSILINHIHRTERRNFVILLASLPHERIG